MKQSTKHHLINNHINRYLRYPSEPKQPSHRAKNSSKLLPWSWDLGYPKKAIVQMGTFSIHLYVTGISLVEHQSPFLWGIWRHRGYSQSHHHQRCLLRTHHTSSCCTFQSHHALYAYIFWIMLIATLGASICWDHRWVQSNLNDQESRYPSWVHPMPILKSTLVQ